MKVVVEIVHIPHQREPVREETPFRTNGAISPRIGVEVADPALARALRDHLQQRLDAAIAEVTLPELPVVPDDDPESARGAIVLLRPDGRAPEALLARAEALEAAGARGIQLVWPGRPRSAEAAVFRVLEAWRGTKRRCPLVLAPDEATAPLLLRTIGLSPG